MAILVLGINHKTASVELREKVAFSDEKRLSALQQIQQQQLAESAVILSTCNRTELYLHNRQISPQEELSQNQQWLEQIIDWFTTLHGLNQQLLRDNLYLAQVKQAYQASDEFYQQQQQHLSGEFSRLFQKSFSTAKRVRSETDIGGSAVSVAYAATSLAKQIFDSLKPLTILFVGV